MSILTINHSENCPLCGHGKIEYTTHAEWVDGDDGGEYWGDPYVDNPTWGECDWCGKEFLMKGDGHYTVAVAV